MTGKEAAARKAAEYVSAGMVVGLGSGSTSEFAIRRIGERVQEEKLDIRAVASSNRSAKLAEELGIPLVPFAEVERIDLTIDGADEVDREYRLIKGGGGALLREKVIAYHSERFIVIVDESKMVDILGVFPLPVEIIPFAHELTVGRLRRMGCEPQLRTRGDDYYVTDNGNYIADCRCRQIPDPGDLHLRLKEIPGVVETGLFVGMADLVIVGGDDGTARQLSAKGEGETL